MRDKLQGSVDLPDGTAKTLHEVSGYAAEDLLESQKDPAAVALGRKGGLKGGRARANSLSAEQRTEIAKRAAAARWAKQ